MASSQYHDILSEKKREIQRENDLFREKVNKYQSDMDKSKKIEYQKYLDLEKKK